MEILLLIKAAEHHVSGFPPLFLNSGASTSEIIFSLRKRTGWRKNVGIFESITCRPSEGQIFLPCGTEGLRWLVLLSVKEVGHPCGSQECCVGIIAIRNAEFTSLCALCHWRLQGSALCSHNGKLDLFQTVERWLLGPYRCSVAFKSRKWHRLLYRVCICN